jgi:hypothetical protein
VSTPDSKWFKDEDQRLKQFASDDNVSYFSVMCIHCVMVMNASWLF